MRARGTLWQRLVPAALAACLAAGCASYKANPAAPVPSATTMAVISRPAAPTTAPGECEVPAGQSNPTALEDGSASADEILAFLNAGGTVADLSAKLAATGLAGEPQESTRVLDLNADGKDDVALALSGRPAAAGGPVILLLCAGDHYVHEMPLGLGEPGTVPVLHAGTDLTADAAADVLVGWRVCGAHTCQERLEVLSLSDQRVLRSPLDPSLDLPFPEIAVLDDGSVTATATSVGSVGAGPFRQYTRTWSWDAGDQAFRVASEVHAPPRYRIHALHDADAAAQLGDLQTALDLYHRVALDDSLLDWVDPATERANLTGYSMFRVVLTYLRMTDEGDAQKAYGILQNQYFAGGPGSAYASMAEALWDRYSETSEVAGACQAARDYAEAQPDEILAPLYFGYANPTYTAEDICPDEARRVNP